MANGGNVGSGGEDSAVINIVTAQNTKTPEQEVLETSEMYIQEHRQLEISRSGFLPDTEYEVIQIENSFPFGTAVSEYLVIEAETGVIGDIGLDELVGNDESRLQLLQEFRAQNDNKHCSEYWDTAQVVFNSCVAENIFKWDSMSKSGGFVLCDMFYKVLQEKNLLNNFRGHCVFWNRKQELPKEHREKSKEELKPLIISRAEEVVTRYSEILEWDVLNEPIKRKTLIKNGVDTSEVIFDKPEDMKFIVELFEKVGMANPKAKKYINEFGILNGDSVDEYYAIVETLLKAGAPIDGIGIQGHIWKKGVPTLEQARASLEKLAGLGLPIKITEFDVSEEAIREHFFAGQDVSDTVVQERRASYINEMLTLFYGTEAVVGVTLWGFQDKSHWRGEEKSGLFNEDFTPNECGQAFLKRVKDDWITKTQKIKADSLGNIKFRGFGGKYKVKNVNTGEEQEFETK
jgi:GH35 family endo-1,4-beta-xylanase